MLRRKSIVNPKDLGKTDLCFLGVNSTRSHWWHAPDPAALAALTKPIVYSKISRQPHSPPQDIKKFHLVTDIKLGCTKKIMTSFSVVFDLIYNSSIVI